MSALALEGITVVSLEQAIAAPFCTRQLADLGARVIKIERPDGGDFARAYDTRVRGMSSHFIWTNRSKESLTLDLKHAEGLAILHELVARADVLVQNLAPGAAARMGLDYEALSAKHPGLIVCDISGYGSDGPYRDRKAYDLLVQSESGFLTITGTPEHMAKAGCSIVDISAGMYAYSSILAALLQRQRDGKGRRIDISMLESMTEWMSFPLYYTFEGAAAPARAGAMHAAICPYGPFECGDGRIVMLGVQNEREWQSFCENVLGDASLMKDPRFASNAQRLLHRDALHTLIIERFASRTAEQVVQLLDDARIAFSQVNTLADLWQHPQLAARGRWTEVDTPVGPVKALLPPGQVEARIDPVPALGQHTDSILGELGYSADAIAALRSANTL